MKVFLSCVSTEFKSHRLRLANQLGALRDCRYEVRVQEDFQQGGFTLLDKLADYIRECDLVIHLAGTACGARPSPEHVRALLRSLGDVPPDPLPEWSYTQWEYQLAMRNQCRMLVYLSAADAPLDCALPLQQTDEEARLQQAHLETIRQSGKHRSGFTSYHTLVREVFHDLGLEIELKINNLPYKSLGSLFKGRDKFLHRIHDTLGRVGHLGHQRFAAITASATAATVHGLGGMGKTRAAIEYAHRYADEYTALLFVRADTPASLQQNLALLSGPGVLDLAEKDTREVDVQVAAVLQWLQQHPGWLLILDNADSDDAAQAVQNLMGILTPSGQVLVTSRLSNWPAAVESLALDVLDEAAAAAFLLERTQARRRKAPDDPEQARAVAIELGGLALALEQAGAYIEHHRCTFAAYLAEWQERRDMVLEWFDPRVMQYPMSVAVTWQTSFDRLSGSASVLLCVLAWLAAEPIPEWLLEAGGGPFGSEVIGQAESKPVPREALSDLEAHSLVTRADETESFSVHRLVQEVTRRRVRGNDEGVDLNSALQWVDNAFCGDPHDVRSWPVLAPLAQHALAVAENADSARISEPTARLMSMVGALFKTKAQYREAEPLYRRALAIGEWTYGPNHPKVGVRLNNLAQLLQSTNRLAEAEPLMRRALVIDEKSYGPDHPEVAIDLDNLSQLLKDTNRLVEAEAPIRRALAIDEKSYGLDHKNVARDLNNLASLLQATNRLAEAEPLMRRALAIDEESYGPEHPNVGGDLNNLAQLLQATNRLAEAEPLMRRALAIDEKSYGQDHPRVAGQLNNLALLLLATNRLDDAEPVMRRALAIDEESYGPEHPNVARDLSNLAQLLKATNNLAEAEILMRRALAIDERSYGQEHPMVAIRLNNLARLLQETSRVQQAELLLRRALTINETSYGSGHPDVASSLSNLAELLRATNRLGEAEPMMQRALAIDEKSCGPDHPAVARDLNNISGLLRTTNRLVEAERPMRRALEILLKFTRDTGHQHPELQLAVDNYASLLQETGCRNEQARAKLNQIANKYGLSIGT